MSHDDDKRADQVTNLMLLESVVQATFESCETGMQKMVLLQKVKELGSSAYTFVADTRKVTKSEEVAKEAVAKAMAK